MTSRSATALTAPVFLLSGPNGCGKDTLGKLMQDTYGAEWRPVIFWIEDEGIAGIMQHTGCSRADALQRFNAHDYKHAPLAFPPFHGLSAHDWKVSKVSGLSAQQLVERPLAKMMAPQPRPLVLTGVRLVETFRLYIQARHAYALPLHQVWIDRANNPLVSSYDRQDGVYPPPSFFDVCLDNVEEHPHAMLEQLETALPTLRLWRQDTSPSASNGR